MSTGNTQVKDLGLVHQASDKSSVSLSEFFFFLNACLCIMINTGYIKHYDSHPACTTLSLVLNYG